jgi:MFS family permease
MYFCYGYCQVLYLYWFPTYLNSSRKFTLTEMGFYSSLPLLAGTIGDFLGGWVSDRWAHRSGNLVLARRAVAITGFLIAAAGIIPATLTADPYLCVVFTCIGVFGLEITIGVSWAIPLDIGGDYAGSVSAVMNTCGNSGGTISLVLAGYLVTAFGWNAPFLVASTLCLIAAVLFSRIDPLRRITSSPV